MSTEVRETTTKRIKRKLECHLSDHEVREKAERMATKITLINTLKEDLKAHNKNEKAEITGHEKDRDYLARQVTYGKEHREVDCTAYYDYTSKRYYVFRDDTHEKIEDRPMTENELGGPLFTGDAAATADEALGTPPAEDDVIQAQAVSDEEVDEVIEAETRKKKLRGKSPKLLNSKPLEEEEDSEPIN